MIIHTARCTLRPFRETDIDALMTYRNDLEWMRFQGFKGLDKQAYIRALCGSFSLCDGAQLAIICHATGVLIGDLYIREDGPDYWIGYTVHPAKARQGYAYEAVSAMISRLRANGATCIKAGVEPGNTASITLLKKLRFQYVETIDGEQIYKEDFS